MSTKETAEREEERKTEAVSPPPDVLSVRPCEMIGLFSRGIKSDWTSMAGRGGISFRL